MKGPNVGIALVLVFAAAQATAAQEPRIRVDPRAELMAIIFKLAGNPEYNRNNFVQYNADIERHFAPFRGHQAVVLARELNQQHGVSFSKVMSIAIRVSDPPELQELVPFDSAGGWPAPPLEMLRFIRAARLFARDSRAAAFFAHHRTLYDSAAARLRRSMGQEMPFDWFTRFFGVPNDRDFVLVPLLANSEGSSGPCVRREARRLECYGILAHVHTDSSGFPVYDEGIVDGVVHELGHGYVNPLGNARRAEFQRSAPRVHAAVADAMAIQSYGWMSMVNESILRAAQARYHIAQQREDRLGEVLREQRAESWLWLEELSGLLGEYESDRETYPTLASFMPRVVAYFDSLPARLPAMQRAYDALRPRIVSLSIENRGEAVDPDLREITVRFDRQVTDDGWSVVPILGPSGPTPEAQKRFPKVTWKALGSTRSAFELGKRFDTPGTVLRFGVELEPGREYELQLNTPHGHGIRSVTDGAPLRPYPIRFMTRDEGR